MIKFIMYVGDNNEYLGFRSEGHAEDAKQGESLVCAGVSTAVFGAYYFIMYGTNAQINMDSSPGLLDVQLRGPNHDAQVALRMLMSMIEMIRTQYDEVEIQARKGVYGS